MIKALFLLPVFLFSQFSFLEKRDNRTIRRVQIFGEMHSGTNYLERLLNENLNAIEVYSGQDRKARPFGQKHFPAWFTRSLEYHKSLGLDEKYWTLENSSDVLFIVIVRDPYDWVRAFFQRPFHVRNAKNFSAFIHRKVAFRVSKDKVNTIDFDPNTRSHFANPLAFRNAKLANILHLPERVNNCYFINYELLRDHPNEVLAEISSLFSIEKKPGFTPIKTYKSTGKAYTGSRYFPIPKNDLSFINERLDWEIESRLGYQIRADVNN